MRVFSSICNVRSQIAAMRCPQRRKKNFPQFVYINGIMLVSILVEGNLRKKQGREVNEKKSNISGGSW